MSKHLVEAVVQRLDAPRQQAAVGLELRLAGSAQADAALLPLEVGPAAHQPRGHVLELRELDLQLAFEAAGTLREDVEDEAAAVEHATLEGLLEVALLARRERGVHHHEVRLEFGDAGLDLVDLASADEEARLGCLARYRHDLEHQRSGRPGQRAELLDAVRLGRVAEAHADEDGSLAVTRPVEQ